MNWLDSLDEKSARRLTRMFAVSFALGTFAYSYFRWATFQYRTFDLAFYVQALWNLLHWKFHVSLLNVPLLGEHASVIVLPMAPLFAILPHPMLLVALQSIALASMAPVGFHIGRHLGLAPGAAAIMALTSLLAPSTGFVALHEFHPEAFSAPFLLLMFEARLRKSLGAHWLWFLAVLSCKENMPLLLIAYCVVSGFENRKLDMRWLVHWCALPMVAATGWLSLYGAVISPRLNAGNVEFVALYSHLGNSPGDIIAKFFTEPGTAVNALGRALSQGNLLWSLLFPFLLLPLLRPQWLLIASPILLQHLLSWRSSEWSVYFHYAAPLLPLFWMATSESVAQITHATWPPCALKQWMPGVVLGACLIAQAVVGPTKNIANDLARAEDFLESRAAKEQLLSRIPSNASVVAPLPYLSHLALRDELFSLHHLLKGLRTLARTAYEPPPPTDFVLVDYDDAATFDASAGYYHPTMRTVGGTIYPSSDRLLHAFLRQASWKVECRNGLALFEKVASPGSATPQPSAVLAEFDAHTHLVSLKKSSATLARSAPLALQLHWIFSGEREVFPWMVLRLSRGNAHFSITKGLCAPEGKESRGVYSENWEVTLPSAIPSGEYAGEAVFFDNSKAAYRAAHSPKKTPSNPTIKTIDLGLIKVER